jgi:hypothetical protein
MATSLDRVRAIQQRQLREWGAAKVAEQARAAKVAAPKMQNIKLDGDGITIHGQTFTREQFKAALDAIRADPQSAYSNARDPNHKAAIAEMNLAYKGLAGELSEGELTEIVTEWNQSLEETTEVATLQPFQELAEMMRDPEVRIAKQRRDAGAPLDARQKEIMARHDQLETANNAQARREQAGAGGTFKTTRPHMIPAELHAIERIADPRERVHAIRQQRAAWRDDKASPYNDVSHPEHKNYVEAMSRLYQAEADLGKQPEDPE